MLVRLGISRAGSRNNVALAVFVCAHLVAFGGGWLLAWVVGRGLEPQAAQWMGFVLRVVFAVAALVLASRDLRSGTLDWRGNWRTDVLWLLGGFAGVLAVAVLGSIPAALTDAPVADNIARREAQVAALGAPLVAVSSWVLAPLTEETVFRLAMIGRASARLPLWLCVTISSVVFGMVHSSQWDAAHLLSILPHILIGAVLGVVYAKSRNITIPILIHAMTNVLG